VVRRYADFVPTYWTESESLSDFGRLMRVRLSQSKVGWVVCRHPMMTVVDVQSMGQDILLRSHTTDISVFTELVATQGYEDVLRALDRPARLIVDLGANTGLASRWLLHHHPSATLVAVEPEPGNAAMLRRNLAPFGDQVRVMECCIGGSRRQVDLVTRSGEFAFYMRDVDAEGGQPGSVEVVTMSDILASVPDQPIDLLKCDIEGAERELFADCSSWIGRVACMVVECHGSYRADVLHGDLTENGGAFEIVSRRYDPAFENEVVVMKQAG
jgi:FkbM family methyltransferase